MFRQKRFIRQKISKKSSFFGKKIYLFFLATVIILGLFYLFFLSSFLLVRAVDIKDNLSCTNLKRLKKQLDIYNKNILFLKEDSVEKRLKKENFCVKDVKISKEFPDKLIIRLIPRKASAILNLYNPIQNSASDLASFTLFESSTSAKINYEKFFSGDTKKLVIDDEGVLFSKDTNNLNVPEINLANVDNLNLGNNVSDEIINGVSILTKLTKERFTILKSSIINEDILVVHTLEKENEPEEITLIFNLENNILKQLASLQLILQRAKMNSESPNVGEKSVQNIEMIDLRFDKPVIRYFPGKN